MSNFIVGNDISNFQGNVDWAIYSKNTNFLIAKASEGTGYIDTWYANNRTQARNYNVPFGSYHFARPDLGNTPESEATFFCNLIDGDPIREGEILALDFEVTYSDPVNWCKAWLDFVSNHFGGMKPLLYLNQSLATSFNWQPVVDAGYGLWIAAYTYDPNNNNFQTGAWKFAAIQQWVDNQQVPGISGNVDGDVFFGDADAFKAYGYKKPVDNSTTTSPPNITTDNPTITISVPVETPPPPVENSQSPPPSATPPIPPVEPTIIVQTKPQTNPFLKLWDWIKKYLPW